MFNLPIELEQHIYEFCIDKRIHWNKVSEQFLKGGYYRKNLRPDRFIKDQQKLCRQYWLSSRPELNGGMTQWNPITRSRDLCPFKYKSEWNIKNKLAVVTFTTRRGERNKFSSKNPVSKWLQNIKKFETYNLIIPHPYLSNTNRYFKVKGNSEFYVKKRAKNEKNKKKEEEIKKGNLFIEERRELKKTIMLSKFGFTVDQKLALSFTEIIQSNPNISNSLKFYRGTIRQIYLKEHRNEFGSRLFTKPRGIHRLDPNAVDNYIGEILISVRFEDGENIYYGPNRLLERIKMSKKNLIDAKKKNFVRGWVEKSNIEAKAEAEHQFHLLGERVVIHDVKYYLSKECVLFNTNGDMVGIYEFGKLKWKGVGF